MFQKKTLFIGHFSYLENYSIEAISAAGNQVQLQILNEIRSISNPDLVVCFSMQPMASWPKGPLFTLSIKKDNIVYPGYVNLPILKNLIFSLRLSSHLIINRPDICVQYNSYLFENLIMILYRRIFKKSKISSVIQDVNCDLLSWNNNFTSIKKIVEWLGIKLLAQYDFLVPVSKKLATDLKIPFEKYFVFQGGVTSYALSLKSRKDFILNNKKRYAVFAGALEPYNGLDKLVNEWVNQNIPYELNIFGNGSLKDFVFKKSVENNNIIFHGYLNEKDIQPWLKNAKWNFCLRYSIGIDQNYFFPSKFFNLLVLDSVLICNHFDNLPKEILPFVHIVSENLENLSRIITNLSNDLNHQIEVERKDEILINYNWEKCIKTLFTKLLIQ